MRDQLKTHFLIECFFSFFRNQLYAGTPVDWCFIINIFDYPIDDLTSHAIFLIGRMDYNINHHIIQTISYQSSHAKSLVIFNCNHCI